MKFLLLVIPAFIAAFLFMSAQSAFADAHHLYNVYVIGGWICAAWVVGFIAYRFYLASKNK